MALDNKISNIVGTKISQWALNQLIARSKQNSKTFRDNDNLLFLANKSGWVRLVSSINLENQGDLTYFNVSNPSDLAKQYVLFGGTSKYLSKNSYQLRSGVSLSDPNKTKDGAYGMLGTSEIQDYGYRPMPGIISANIETQGRMGSVRAATINFKCWDKQQLDIIDALYFKLGFTMFLEWGQTYFYYSQKNTLQKDSTKVYSSDEYSIDPFQDSLTKEQIQLQINKNVRNTEGNYDAMLGIVTNFNFSLNQEGGYDCSVRLMALGVLGDSLKVNNQGNLPNILKEEIIQLTNTLVQISRAQQKAQEKGAQNLLDKKSKYPACVRDLGNFSTPPATLNGKNRLGEEAIAATVAGIQYYFYPDGQYQTTGFGLQGKYECNNNKLLIDGKPADPTDFTYEQVLESNKQKISGTRVGSRGGKATFINNLGGDDYFAIDRFKALMPQNVDQYKVSVKLDIPKLSQLGNAFTTQDPVELLVNADKLNNIVNGKLVPIQEGDQINYTENLGVLLNSRAEGDISKVPAQTGISITGQILNFLIGGFGTSPYNSSLFYKTNSASSEITFLYSNASNYLEDSDLDKLEKSGLSEFENNIFKLRRTLSTDNEVQKIIRDTISNNQIEWKVKSFNNGFFELVCTIQIPKSIDSYQKNELGNYVKSGKKTVNYELELKLVITDIDVISEIIIAPDPDLITPKIAEIAAQNVQQTNTAQDEAAAKAALYTQISEALKTQSALELTLRTIQVHALNKAFDKYQNLAIGNLVYQLKLDNYDDKSGGVPFIQQIFSNGIFSSFINELIGKDDKGQNISSKISLQYAAIAANYNSDKKTLSRLDTLKIQSKYGFATNLMGGLESIKNFKPTNFNKILNAYVAPYEINQQLNEGVPINHPVYIPLGLLIMILNHNCTMYDSKDDKDIQTPIVYVDFNTEHNFCLTNKKQLSTNPWKVLIPFEGSFQDYKEIFDPVVLETDKNGKLGDYIKPSEGTTQKIPLFNPELNDKISGQIPPFKDVFTDNAYRGQIMNILVNIDYLIKLVKDYSTKDENNSIYLKTFLEQIISDLNKYLGNINIFRLAYNDQGNTFYITDDQLVPPREKEELLTPDNTTEIPVFGKESITKNLEVKSEVSSRLANMLAISANADVANKSTLSTNGDPFGFVNTSYKDRYIPNRKAIENNATGSQSSPNNQQKSTIEMLKNASAEFNKIVSDFYSTNTPSETSVSHATGFFIERMSKIKNNEFATRASAIIPVSVNFTTDGFSGLSMYQAFTIPDKILPYTYNLRQVLSPGGTPYKGLGPDYINKVGFVVVGLNHTLENNQWNTSVRAQMTYLKDINAFADTAANVSSRVGPVTAGVNSSNFYHGSMATGASSTVQRNINQTISLPSTGTSQYIFGSAKNLGNTVTSKAHGARDDQQRGQWQSERGWDLIVSKFTPVYAIFSGTVNNVNYLEKIPYYWGFRFTLVGLNEAFYTHLDRVVVASGTKVNKGDLLGYVGQPPSEYTWSPHLHIALKTGELSTYITSDGKIK